MKRSLFALILALITTVAFYFCTGGYWEYIGIWWTYAIVFFIFLHLNFTVLTLTLGGNNYIKKLKVAYEYGLYALLFGGIGIFLWVFVTLFLLVISPLYYVFAGRKYEDEYGAKKHKNKKSNDRADGGRPKTESAGSGAKSSGEFISLKDVPFADGSDGGMR